MSTGFRVPLTWFYPGRNARAPVCRIRAKIPLMPTVETVQGPVDAGALGKVLVHEHVRFRDEAVADQWPDQYEDEAEYGAACEAVSAAAKRGVETIFDPTAMFGGRDVEFMRRVADGTRVQILACTGIYTYEYLPHYFANRDVDHMA